MRKIERLIVHWSASGSETTLEDIRRWHVVGNGWRDIGYHLVILHPAGCLKPPKAASELIVAGRPDQLVGAHTRGFNTNSLGICLVSGPASPLHGWQKEALAECLEALLKTHKLSWSQVFVHSDFAKTACPGDQIRTLVENWKTRDAS